MDIEIQISFDINSVYVQAGKLNKKFANWIALDKTLRTIVAIGETEAEIAARDPQRWEKMKANVRFEPIFEPRNFHAENIYWATRMLASNIHHELRGVNLFDKIICNVNIPKYELFPTAATRRFEMRLERWPKLRTLCVNGVTVISKGWQYNFAQLALNWGWQMLLATLAIVFVRNPGLLFTLFKPLMESSPFGIIFGFLLLALGMIWLTEIIWMSVMQWLLPKQTLRRMFMVYQLQFVRANKRSISKMLANWILGKDE